MKPSGVRIMRQADMTSYWHHGQPTIEAHERRGSRPRARRRGSSRAARATSPGASRRCRRRRDRRTPATCVLAGEVTTLMGPNLPSPGMPTRSSICFGAQARAEARRHDVRRVALGDVGVRVDDRLLDESREVGGLGLARRLRAACSPAIRSSSDGPVVPLDLAGVNVWQPPQPALLKTARPGVLRRLRSAFGRLGLGAASATCRRRACESTWMFLKCISPWPEPHSSVHCTS